MSVVVRDLVPAFLEFWSDPDRQWGEYVEQHPDVLNDFTRSGRTPTREQVEKALASYPERETRIRANAPHGRRWIEQAADRVVPLLEAEHLDIEGVAMVGLGTSNGWVNDGTLYLAVELIPDERAAEILAAHEIAHALQFPLPEQPWSEDGPLGQRIYSEGFATALTAELFPQYSLPQSCSRSTAWPSTSGSVLGTTTGSPTASDTRQRRGRRSWPSWSPRTSR